MYLPRHSILGMYTKIKLETFPTLQTHLNYKNSPQNYFKKQQPTKSARNATYLYLPKTEQQEYAYASALSCGLCIISWQVSKNKSMSESHVQCFEPHISNK